MSRAVAARTRFGPLLPIGIASLIAAVLAVRLLTDGTLWYFDTTKVFLPNAIIWHEALAAGSLPLWWDSMGLGFPLYAEGQIGSFYPPNALLHLLEPFAAMEVSRIVHLAIAGLGAGVLVLRLTGSRQGAIVAAAGTVLGGGIVSKLEWTNVVVAYAYVPWIFIPLVRTPAPTLRGVLVAGALWGVQGLAGHPNTWVLTGIALASVMIAVAPRPATLARIVLLGFVAAGVYAPQLLSTLQLWSLSVRTGGLADWDLFSNSATAFDVLLPGFANAFLPLGPQESDFAQQWYPGGLWGLHEAGAYLGLPMLALAGAGFSHRRARPLVVLALVMVGIAVVGAFRPTPWLEAPILNGLRHPARAYMFAGVGLSVVAGIGVARIRRARFSRRAAAAPVLVSVAAYAVILAATALAPAASSTAIGWAFGLPAEAAEAARTSAVQTMLRPYPLIVELLLGVGTLAVLAAPAAGKRAFARAATVGALALVSLALFSPPINPIRPEAAVQHTEGGLIQAVRERNPHRFLALVDPSWYHGIPNQLAVLGVRELGMHSSLNLEGTSRLVTDIRFPETDVSRAAAVGVDLLAAFGGRECPGRLETRVDANVALCAVEEATSPPYWLPADAVGPPATPERSGTATAIHSLLGIRIVDRDIDVGRALSESEPIATIGRDDSTGDFRVTASAPGWVWIDRAWWPGWETTVGGRPVDVDRAMGGQLVPVPVGESVIAQRMVPREAWTGGIVCVATLALVSTALHRRSRREREPESGQTTS